MRETKKGMPFTIYMYGIFSLTTFLDNNRYKFKVREAYFCAESIGVKSRDYCMQNERVIHIFFTKLLNANIP